jgi:hypothetical protein
MKIDSIAVSKPSRIIEKENFFCWSSMKRKVFRITDFKTCRYINFMSLKKNDFFY